ncbi:MAG TPA: glucose 1-dehydrogenase [Chloroflexota bacterium]|nr:glucose 1-dehydrogenase [Chloroflexota bacterium]
MTGRFDNKVVVITGAAGAIGRAAAVRFAVEGARVVLVDLAASSLDDAVAAAKAAGADAFGVAADVTQSDDVERYATAATERFGTIDCFFNNAGIEGAVKPLIEYPEEIFDRVIAVNLKGVWLGLKHVAAVMRKHSGGAIVNTASVAGLHGSRGIIAYVASKHAVVGMTRVAALELAQDGIRVNAVCPSPIETRMMRALESGLNPADPESVRARITAGNPMQRYGNPEEVAAVVAFLCSPDASYINGGVYPIDGGSTA